MLTPTDSSRRNLEIVRPVDALERRCISAVVLAGDHKWRRDSSESLGPRATLPVAGLPLIGHALEWLADHVVANITVCSNGDALVLQRALQSRAEVPPIKFHDDAQPRGPAGCAADVIRDSDADVVLIVEASVLPTINVRRLLREHIASRAMATIVVQPRGAAPEGKAEIPVGIYVFSREAFASVPETGYQDIKEGMLRRLYLAGALVRVHNADEWCPRVMDSRSYLEVSQWAIRRATRRHGSAVIVDPTATIAENALLVGPVIVAAGAEIMDGASVIGPVMIGERSVVRPHAVVSRAVVWDHCVIEAAALVDQTVLTSGVIVPERAHLIEVLRVPSGPQSAAAKSRPARRWRASAAPEVVTVGSARLISPH